MAARADRGSDETTSSGHTASSGNTTSSAFTAASSVSSGEEKFLPELRQPTEQEARAYYANLPSMPRLVGRTSSGVVNWEPAIIETGPWTIRQRRILAPIGQHKIRSCWNEVEPHIETALSSLPWTSIDVFRIGFHDIAISQRPVVVWVGIHTDLTENLQWSTVARALRSCRKTLDQFGLEDVECEMRFANVYALAGPPLFSPPYLGSYPEQMRPLSTSIGQDFFGLTSSNVCGTLGMYLRTKRTDKPRYWALTCRHVALPYSKYPHNMGYRRQDPNSDSVKMCVTRDEVISNAKMDVRDSGRTHERALGNEGISEEEAQKYANVINDARQLLERLESFSDIENRVVGEVFCASPIEQGKNWPFPWTRDWCLVELHQDKFPSLRNVVDLHQSDLKRQTLEAKLNPNVRNRKKFTYPPGGFFQLSGIVSVSEMEHPTTLDEDGKECILVGKRGATTGVTWGCPSELLSTTRQCLPGQGEFKSREWAVKGSLGDMSTPFSKGGDSGAVVFDVGGRVGGLLTRVSASHDRAGLDITYVTPMQILLADVERAIGMEVVIV